MIRSQRLFQFILITNAPEITSYPLSINIPLDLRNHARLEALKLFENTNKYFSLWIQPPLPPSRLHKSILIEGLLISRVFQMPEVQLKDKIENHDNFFSETYISNHSIFLFIETVSGDSP